MSLNLKLSSQYSKEMLPKLPEKGTSVLQSDQSNYFTPSKTRLGDAVTLYPNRSATKNRLKFSQLNRRSSKPSRLSIDSSINLPSLNFSRETAVIPENHLQQEKQDADYERLQALLDD